MRIVVPNPGILNGILRCSECDGPMVKVAEEYRCVQKVEPEELVAVGFIPVRDASGKLRFDSTAKDQQLLQATQAYSNTVEIDNSYLEKIGLDLEKIRAYQLRHGVLP